MNSVYAPTSKDLWESVYSLMQLNFDPAECAYSEVHNPLCTQSLAICIGSP